MKIRLSDGARGGVLAVALIALAQLPFWLIQTRVSLQRPLINLDLLAAIVIMLWRRPLGMVALVLAWIVEINQDASASYHFVGAVDLIDAVRFMDLVRLDHILSPRLLLAFAAFGLCGFGIYRVARSSRSAALATVLIGTLSFVVDGANGSNYAVGLSDRFHVGINVAGSSSVTTMRELRRAWRGAAEPMARFPDPIAFDRAVAWHERHPAATVLIVLVESMGAPSSPALRDWLVSRLDSPEIERRWSVQPTAEAFHGSTVYGELRVLCGLNGHYSRLKAQDEEGCLPRRFVRDGGQALGLHGFNLRMFDRALWWRQLGLQPQDLGQAAASDVNMGCNEAFPGVCDAVLLQRAAELARRPGRLVYAVTLDTHLPLSSRGTTLQPDLATLCARQHVSSDACQMVNRLGTLLDQLRTELQQMPEPVLVLVSGDHAPPFLAEESRNAFDPSRVLGFVLQPR